MGNPGDPRLLPYSERSFKQTDPALVKCQKALQQLNDLSDACKSLSKHAVLFGSFRNDMFGHSNGPAPGPGEDPQKKRNRAAYEATEVLLASLVLTKLLAEPLDNHGTSQMDGAMLDALIQFVTPVLLLDDPDDARCPKTQQLLSRSSILAELPQLRSGLEHYIEMDPARYDDQAEMLFMFLKGIEPLPRCTHSVGLS